MRGNSGFSILLKDTSACRLLLLNFWLSGWRTTTLPPQPQPPQINKASFGCVMIESHLIVLKYCNIHISLCSVWMVQTGAHEGRDRAEWHTFMVCIHTHRYTQTHTHTIKVQVVVSLLDAGCHLVAVLPSYSSEVWVSSLSLKLSLNKTVSFLDKNQLTLQKHIKGS